MKVILKILFTLVLSALLINCTSQEKKSFFKKVFIEKDSTCFGRVGDYRLLIDNDSFIISNCTYSDMKNYLTGTSDSIKIMMIADLLNYENDTNICAIPIKCYSPYISQIFNGKTENYSIKLEALFLINIIYFEEPFSYSPYPILYDNKNGKVETIDGDLINKAYVMYKKWFLTIKNTGFKKSKKLRLLPLSSEVNWYR